MHPRDFNRLFLIPVNYDIPEFKRMVNLPTPENLFLLLSPLFISLSVTPRILVAFIAVLGGEMIFIKNASSFVSIFLKNSYSLQTGYFQNSSEEPNF